MRKKISVKEIYEFVMRMQKMCTRLYRLKLKLKTEQYFLIFLFLAVAVFFVEFLIMVRKSLNIVLLRRKRALYMGFTVLLSLYKLGRAAQCDPRKIKSFGS